MEDDSDFSSNSQEDISSEQPTLQNYQLSEVDRQQIPSAILDFWDNYETVYPFDHFQFPKSQKVSTQVCAKVVRKSDVVIQCLDCQVDDTCIICLECFKNGNHQGHKYYAKKAGGGCCDCGDKEAWAEAGFCKNHSGKAKEIQISGEVQNKLNEILDGLFYRYFWMTITNNAKMQHYSKALIECLKELNKSDLFYNQLTFKWMNRPLQPPYTLNEELDKRTILENIFTFRISKNLIADWFQFMMLLFPYYPAKLGLLTHYMKNQSLLIDGSEDSMKYTRSISCQLLTSYQLISQYVATNEEGLASNFTVPSNTDECISYLFYLFYDFDYIMKCSGNTPLVYWRMHLKKDIDVVFSYYENMKKKVKKIKQKQEISDSFLNVKYIKFAIIEMKLLSFMANLVGVIRFDKSLLTLIKILLNKIKEDYEETHVVLYRPYERCLGIALFAYFQMDLNNVNSESFEELMTELDFDKKQGNEICRKMYRKVIATFFQYSKCLVQTGYRTSLYNYLYHYKIKNRLIAVTDIITLKILILLGVQPVITIQNMINFPTEMENEPSQEIIKEKQVYLEIILKEMSLLYVSKSCEIFLSHQIDPNCDLYQKEMKELLLLILKQCNGALQLQVFNKLKIQLFHHQSNIENLIKSFTVFNKERKEFISQVELDDLLGMNFDNFRLNMEKKQTFQNPQKTQNLVKQYNIRIFCILWNEQSTKKLIKILMKLQQSEKENESAKKMILSEVVSIAFLQQRNELECFEMFKTIVLSNEKNISWIPEEIANKLSIEKSTDTLAEELNVPSLKRMKTKQDKMKKMKAKQSKFLESMIDEPMEEKKSKTRYTCCICKNEEDQQFVYPVRIAPRNHEKLLKLGKGVHCFSFSSCNHVFDYSCLIKSFNQGKIKNSLKCPLCKKSANNLLPITQTPPLKTFFMERFIQIVFSYKDGADSNEQLLKSFYHFVLLAHVNVKHCFTKRLKIYQILFKIVNESLSKKQVGDLYKLFKEEKMKTKFQQKKKSDKKGFPKNSLYFKLVSFFRGQSQQVEEGSDEEFVSDPNLLPLANNVIAVQNQQEKVIEEKQDYSILFYGTMVQLFKHLKMEGPQEESINPIISMCFNALRNENFELAIDQKIPEYEKIIKQLPKTFAEIAEIKKCDFCQELSQDLIMCLICHWVGCQKCQKGKIKNHTNEEHGEICVFMLMESGRVGYLVDNSFFLTGFVYEDEWGRPAKIKNSWHKYELNKKLIRKIENQLILDEIENN